MAINYKILCEVKLLHEYYLTDKDGSTIFDLPSQAARLIFLRKRFGFNYPSVDDLLHFEPVAKQKEIFGNLKLKVINTYSGFKLFAAVKEEVLAGNIKAYRPSQTLSDALPVLIHLRYKKNSLDSLSNRSIKRPLAARYYFTNRNLGTAQQPPVLSRSLPLRDDSLRNEQGELAVDPADNLAKAFFFEKDGTLQWEPISGNGFVNSNDCALLPHKFIYKFSKSDGISDVTFELKDNTNAVVSTLSRNSIAPLEQVMLDYSAVISNVLTADSSSGILPFTLTVTDAGGYKMIHPVIFCSNDLLQSDTFGLVHLQPRVGDPFYHLLDNEGRLITRKNPDGSIIPPPVFEIRIKSRFSFWRYVNTRQEKILDNPALHPFLIYDPVNGKMETKKMLNMSYTPVEFINGGVTQYLPNPEENAPLKNELKRVYVDVMVPESGLFKI